MASDDFRVHDIRPNKNKQQDPLTDAIEKLKKAFGQKRGGNGGGNGPS